MDGAASDAGTRAAQLQAEQEAVKKQQELFAVLSNLTKTLHAMAMATIVNRGA